MLFFISSVLNHYCLLKFSEIHQDPITLRLRMIDMRCLIASHRLIIMISHRHTPNDHGSNHRLRFIQIILCITSCEQPCHNTDQYQGYFVHHIPSFSFLLFFQHSTFIFPILSTLLQLLSIHMMVLRVCSLF